MNAPRVAIVDQQPLYRRGIRVVVESAKNCRVVGDFSTVEPLYDLLRARALDVALVHTAVFDSCDMRESMRSLHVLVPRFPVIFLAAEVDQERLFQAVLAGVVAYEPRTISSDRLVAVILAASRGEYLLHEAVAQSRPRIQLQQSSVLLQEGGLLRDEASYLTSRELEILTLIASGNTNKAISHMLTISDQTVKNHITSILKKLSVTDRTAAVVHALRKGWIKIEELQDIPA